MPGANSANTAIANQTSMYQLRQSHEPVECRFAGNEFRQLVYYSRRRLDRPRKPRQHERAKADRCCRKSNRERCAGYRGQQHSEAARHEDERYREKKDSRYAAVRGIAPRSSTSVRIEPRAVDERAICPRRSSIRTAAPPSSSEVGSWRRPA